MVVKCEDVWREISNYFEGDLDPALKLAMENHFAQCTGCQSVRDGMRNVIELYGEIEMFTLPAGFHPRLRGRLSDQVEGRTQELGPAPMSTPGGSDSPCTSLSRSGPVILPPSHCSRVLPPRSQV
jgi:hypothetical protein